MKTLTPVESVAEEIVDNFTTAKDLNTHKAVVEVLDGMKKDLFKEAAEGIVSAQATAGWNKALTDAIQKMDELFGVSK